MSSHLSKLTQWIERFANTAGKVAAIVAEVALLAMMLLTVADVVGRYFFNSPITGTYELVGLSLIGAGTLGWGYCQMKKAHISITILTVHFSKKIQAILKSFSYALGLMGFSLLCWRVFVLAKQYIILPRGGTTITLHIPFFPFMLLLAIASGIFALILLIDFVKSLTKVNER